MSIPIGPSITSADVIFMLRIPGVFDSPIQIKGFAPDDVLDLDSKPLVETHQGVDGHMSQGFIYHLRKMTIHLAADSGSQVIFDTWADAMVGRTSAISASGTIIFPGNQTKYHLLNGALTGYRDIPNAKKTLQPQTYEITWESIIKQAV